MNRHEQKAIGLMIVSAILILSEIKFARMFGLAQYVVCAYVLIVENFKSNE